MKEKYLLDSNILIHHQRDYQNRELDFTLVRAKAKSKRPFLIVNC